ncbi:MAG TPA: hypothetical protein DD666_07495 [Advenella kashmirensis]|uniref:Uncharacterized protein n=1 Tax=Advenella kashmirensis TaxID=310575 RepID=A0A356LE90_9BURK|nr:hypothetical protein [Advenella kashmirensis]
MIYYRFTQVCHYPLSDRMAATSGGHNGNTGKQTKNGRHQVLRFARGAVLDPGGWPGVTLNRAQLLLLQ